MTDETNDMIPGGPEKKLPAALDIHLRAMMPDKDLSRFCDQLPAEFISDASEGLDQFKDTKQLEPILQKLNQQMHRHLTHKNTNRKRRSIGDLSWVYWTIIIIILLAFASFIVIRMLMHH